MTDEQMYVWAGVSWVIILGWIARLEAKERIERIERHLGIHRERCDKCRRRSTFSWQKEWDSGGVHYSQRVDLCERHYTKWRKPHGH